MMQKLTNEFDPARIYLYTSDYPNKKSEFYETVLY